MLFNTSDQDLTESSLDNLIKTCEKEIKKVLSFSDVSSIDIIPVDKINKAVQTFDSTSVKEESAKHFLPYKCFYCGVLIKSKEEVVVTHREVCQETGLVIRLNISECENVEQLNMNEALESYLHHQQTIAARVFKCDLCQETFESEMLFGMHNVFTHSRVG